MAVYVDFRRTSIIIIAFLLLTRAQRPTLLLLRALLPRRP